MKWNVIYSARARSDLRNIYEYIAYNLLAPETAARQSRRIMKEIRALDEMPMRHPVYKDEPWNSQGVRYFPVDNYLVFYLPDELQNIVNIIRIMYGGRDIRSQCNKEQ